MDGFIFDYSQIGIKLLKNNTYVQFQDRSHEFNP